jgi:hypothetical protein
LTAFAPTAPAQTLKGRVIDARTTVPTSGSTIVIQDDRGSKPRQATTDSAGGFLVVLRSDGLYTLTVTKLGYVQHRGDTVRIGTSESVSVEVRLDQTVMPLNPVIVTDRVSWLPDGFEQRRAAGFGRFLTRKDIDQRRASNTSDLLRGIPGIVLVPTRRGRGSTSELMMRGFTGLCQPALWIDGVHLSSFGDAVVDQVLSPGVLEAAEIYNSTSAAPAQYRTGNCGVVLFWTRRNADNEGKRISWWKLCLGAATGIGLVLLLK